MLSVASVVLVISMGWRFSGYLNEAARGVISSDVLFLIMAYRLLVSCSLFRWAGVLVVI